MADLLPLIIGGVTIFVLVGGLAFLAGRLKQLQSRLDAFTAASASKDSSHEEAVEAKLDQVIAQGSAADSSLIGLNQAAGTQAENLDAVQARLQETAAQFQGALDAVGNSQITTSQELAGMASLLQQYANAASERDALLQQITASLQDGLARLPRETTKDEQLATLEEFKVLFAQVQGDPHARRSYARAMLALDKVRPEAVAYLLEAAGIMIKQAVDAGRYDILPLLSEALRNVLQEPSETLSPAQLKEVHDRTKVMRTEIQQRIDAEINTWLDATDVEPETLKAHLEFLSTMPVDQELGQRLATRVRELDTEITQRRLDARLGEFAAALDALEQQEADAAVQQIDRLESYWNILIAEPASTERPLFTSCSERLQRLRQIFQQQQAAALVIEQSPTVEQDRAAMDAIINQTYAGGELLAQGESLQARLFAFLSTHGGTLQEIDPQLLPPALEMGSLVRLLERWPKVKTRSYNLWSLRMVRRARARFKAEKKLFSGADETGRILQDILSQTLWTVDERHLDSSVLPLYHQVRQELLEKCDEDHRLELIRQGLSVAKVDFYDLPADVNEP